MDSCAKCIHKCDASVMQNRIEAENLVHVYLRSSQGNVTVAALTNQLCRLTTAE